MPPPPPPLIQQPVQLITGAIGCTIGRAFMAMSAAEAEPVNAAAVAARASANFFIFKSPPVKRQNRRLVRVRRHRFPNSSDATIRSSARNAVAGEAHSSENETPKSRGNRRFSALNGVKKVGIRPKPSRCAGLHVQQIFAGEFRLVGDEGESGLGLGAH